MAAKAPTIPTPGVIGRFEGCFRLSLDRFIDLTSAGAQRISNTANKGRMAEGGMPT